MSFILLHSNGSTWEAALRDGQVGVSGAPRADALAVREALEHGTLLAQQLDRRDVVLVADVAVVEYRRHAAER